MEKQLVSDKDRLNSIPTELFISILSRLPVKAVGRCRCVSKQWASILHFTDLFLKVSLARPCLLFTFKLNGKWLFLSAPQPLNSDQMKSSPLIADRHMSFPTGICSIEMSSPVSGLLCSRDMTPMICNPSTGQHISLPKLTQSSCRVKTFLGYDPMDKLYKVLHVYEEECQVLTLGAGRELPWRRIECPKPHLALPNGICINGVLYYLGIGFGRPFMVVCFDVRSEKFTCLAVEDSFWEATLINCNGKLGVVFPDPLDYFRATSISLVLWVLDDAKIQKWSTHIYLLPPLWRDLVGDTLLNPVGMTRTGEFVFSSNYLADPFHIFYYNVVRNTIVRFEVQLGIVFEGRHKIYTFMDHVEDMKLMEVL